jgi:DNA-binding LacI/PurR family transcriptional regulator
MTTSIQDVAHKAGVSISTVSRSFTRPDLVSAKTRERVLAIADELNFSLSRSAAALKSGRSLRIAVLMSGHIRLWFTASVIEGLNEVLHAEGYDISIFQISSIEERREFFEMLPVRRNADAVIVASFDIDNNEIAQLASADVPIVGINSVNPEDRGFAATVNIDDVQGSTLAARHLINLGHRRIAYISTDRDVSLCFSVQCRFDSFTACCLKEGIEPQVIVCKVDDAGHYQISDVVTQLMSLDEMPTAIACQEDGIALPLLFQLERNGFSVPADVSLIGYDDSFYTEDIGLTTIRQNPVGMARKAALLTLDLIEERPIDEPYVMFPAQLVVRSSTTRATRGGRHDHPAANDSQ